MYNNEQSKYTPQEVTRINQELKDNSNIIDDGLRKPNGKRIHNPELLAQAFVRYIATIAKASRILADANTADPLSNHLNAPNAERFEAALWGTWDDKALLAISLADEQLHQIKTSMHLVTDLPHGIKRKIAEKTIKITRMRAANLYKISAACLIMANKS